MAVTYAVVLYIGTFLLHMYMALTYAVADRYLVENPSSYVWQHVENSVFCCGSVRPDRGTVTLELDLVGDSGTWAGRGLSSPLCPADGRMYPALVVRPKNSQMHTQLHALPTHAQSAFSSSLAFHENLLCMCG